MANFTRVSTDSISQKVALHIRQAIYAGELKPGERIIETRVAREMEVAQSSVREALQDLEHLGLIVKIPNKGSFVVELSKEQSEQMYLVRRELEGLAMQLARRRRTPEDIRQLRHHLTTMREGATREDFNTFIEADLNFHRHIWRLSGNVFLEKALVMVTIPQFAYYRIGALRGLINWNMKDLLRSHSIILEFVEERRDDPPEQIFGDLVTVVMKGIRDGKRTRADAPKDGDNHEL